MCDWEGSCKCWCSNVPTALALGVWGHGLEGAVQPLGNWWIFSRWHTLQTNIHLWCSANITSCFVQGDVKLVCCWELHSLGKHLFCSTCPVNDGKILGCHLTQNTQSLEIDSIVSEKSWWGNLAMVICWISRVDGQILDCWRWLWGVNVRPRLILVHFLL